MRVTRVLAILAMAGSLGIGTAEAQNRERLPAEFPPASYKGKQYVDSKGCVFIRAGIDGDVSWVPRVNRAREVVCGFVPTLGAQVASAAPAPAARPAQEPVQITLNDTVAAPAAPAPRATAVARPAAPVVVRQQPAQPVIAPAPRVVAAAPVVTAPRQATAQVVSACPGASAISQRYLRASAGVAVRCGPQTEPIVGTGSVAGVAHSGGTSVVTSTTRIVPKHVAENRVNTRNVAIPHGYKEVWDDDRLNPNRAEQNLQGRSDMLLIWTQTVPRRLIDRRSGRDVTASVPLVYPYTDVVTQRRELGEVTLVQRDGQRVKRIVRNPGAAPVQRAPVYSSRSAPKEVAPQAALTQTRTAPSAVAGKRYVQIGKFNNASDAQAAAQRVARMGMPARIGKHRSGGATHMTVQAGPFDTAPSLQRAMQKLRGAGYSDAFARN